jgi:hypothetical protein
MADHISNEEIEDFYEDVLSVEVRDLSATCELVEGLHPMMLMFADEQVEEFYVAIKRYMANLN